MLKDMLWYLTTQSPAAAESTVTLPIPHACKLKFSVRSVCHQSHLAAFFSSFSAFQAWYRIGSNGNCAYMLHNSVVQVPHDGEPLETTMTAGPQDWKFVYHVDVCSSPAFYTALAGMPRLRSCRGSRGIHTAV